MRHARSLSGVAFCVIAFVVLAPSYARADIAPSEEHRMMVGHPWLVLGGVGARGIATGGSGARVSLSARLGYALSTSVELRLGADLDLDGSYGTTIVAVLALFLPEGILARTFVGAELELGAVVGPGDSARAVGRIGLVLQYRHAAAPYSWSGGESYTESDSVPFYIELAVPELTYVTPGLMAIGATLRAGVRF